MDELRVLIDEYKNLYESFKSLYEKEKADKEKTEKELKAQIDDLKLQLLIAKEKNEVLTKKLFGNSSEKAEALFNKKHEGEIDLFNEAELESSIAKGEVPPEDETICIERKKHNTKRNYKELLDKLPHKEVLYTLPEENKICDKCGSELHSIGKKFIRSEIEITPAVIRVIDIYQESFECRKCRKENLFSSIYSAPVPISVIPNSYASASTVAKVFADKYAMGIPLYRQETTWNYLGFPICRGTLANWIIYASHNYLSYIVERLHKLLLKEKYVHCDESTLQVLKEPDKAPTTNSYMWVYSTVKESKHPIRIFDYRPNRKAENPIEFLNGFNGVAITDAYSAYGKLPGVTNSYCHAHSRRLFVEAIPAKKKDSRYSQAKKAIEYYKKLFKIEDEIADLSPDEKVEKRQELSKPIFEEFVSWCKKMVLAAGKDTKLYKAFNYTINHEEELSYFLKDGLVPMTNSLAERTIRGYAIGRNNWLFSDSVKGAEASAIAYTIVSTCKANGLDPLKYLTFLFKELPGNIDRIDKEPDRIDIFLPWSELPQKLCRTLSPSNNKEEKPSDYVNY